MPKPAIISVIIINHHQQIFYTNKGKKPRMIAKYHRDRLFNGLNDDIETNYYKDPSMYRWKVTDLVSNGYVPIDPTDELKRFLSKDRNTKNIFDSVMLKVKDDLKHARSNRKINLKQIKKLLDTDELIDYLKS